MYFEEKKERRETKKKNYIVRVSIVVVSQKCHEGKICTCIKLFDM